jgi:hypothetical protein
MTDTNAVSGGCSHIPCCPSADSADRAAARTIAPHPEQGWALLCNHVVIFDDGGLLLPERAAVPATV